MPEPSRSILTDGRALVIVVVVGGLFILQGSNNLDAAKIVYLLCAAAAVALALISLPWWLSQERSAIARPWLVFIGAAIVLLILSLAVSRAHGTPFALWLRDAASYALLAAAPILALACARVASRRWLVAVLTVCGSLASVSFAIEWIGRRQLASLPIDRIALPSEALAAALLALATATALTSTSRKWSWAAIAGVVLGLFFASGSRSTLLLLAIPIGVAPLAEIPRRLASRVLFTELVIAIAVFFVAAAGIPFVNANFPSSTTSAATSAPDKLGERVNQVGSLLTNPGNDLSLQARVEQTKVAWQAFSSSPLVGVGPGYEFHWSMAAVGAVDSFTLDTPMIYPAKFGLLGLVPLALFAAAYLRLTLELWRRRQRARMESLLAIGFGIVLAILGLQGSPIEDKGASFALILVLALGVRRLVLQEPAGGLADGSVSAP
jgi:O-antigen ligase